MCAGISRTALWKITVRPLAYVPEQREEGLFQHKREAEMKMAWQEEKRREVKNNSPTVNYEPIEALSNEAQLKLSLKGTVHHWQHLTIN